MTKTSDPKILDTAKGMAEDAAQAAEAKAKRGAAKARDRAAEETQKAANAAEAAAGEFDAGSVQAQAIEHVARRIDDIADQLRTTDIDRMASMIGDAARKNPMLFVAGAALAGFAVTRFLKARDPQRSFAAAEGDDPWAAPTDRTQSNPTSRGPV